MMMFKQIGLVGLVCFALGAWMAPGEAAAAAGKFSIVSTGPGDPQHITVKAIETIKQADLVLCDDRSAQRLQQYLQGKKVEDPWKELWTHQGKIWMKDLATFPAEERPAIIALKKKQRDEFVHKMKGLLGQGKKVALLDGGDPTIFSRAFWLVEGLDEAQWEIIPGVGAATASMAALKKASTGGGARYVAQTAPYSFFAPPHPEDLASDLSKYPGTLIFYMGLSEMGKIVDTLKKFNPPDLPVAVVYYAGYADKEKVVQGTLADIMAKISAESEKWMGMIIVGRCLTGPHFTLSY